jgi:hypothetical protein
MKKLFKKAITVLGSAALVGATMGVAVAASYPDPFVGNTAIVYGSSAAPTDMTAAGLIRADLVSESAGSLGGGSSTVSGGDSVQIQKSTDRFNLGNNINSFYTTLDDSELSTLLKKGVYQNEDNDDYEYDQEVNFGSILLTAFTDSKFNDEKPTVGFEIASSTTILNYTLDFSPDNVESSESDWNSLEGTEIEILGKQYYVLSATNNGALAQIDLLDSAASNSLAEGESVTITTDKGTYDVSISFISTNQVKLIVNGETTKTLNEDDTFKLSTGDYIGIKEINVQNYQGGTKNVEFSVGSGKIELKDNTEIKVNNEDVSDIAAYSGHKLVSYVTNSSSGELDSIVIKWMTDTGSKGEKFLGFGTDSTSLTMPVFNNLKLHLGNLVYEAEEVTKLDPSSTEDFQLDTTLTDGDVSIDLFYTNGTAFTGIGDSATSKLLTNTTALGVPKIVWDVNSTYFVATWINGDDHESYLLEVSDIDDSNPTDNSTTIKSVATGSTQGVTLDVGETDSIGQISFTLDAASEDGDTATIQLGISGSGSGTVYADRIVTAEGLDIQLPFNSATETGTNVINLTGLPTTYTMQFTEETEAGDIKAGVPFSAVLGFNSGETTVASVNVTDFKTEKNSDDYIGLVASDLATQTMFYTGGDQDSLDITYHGGEAYAEVFLSEAGTSIGGGDTGVMTVTDAEAASMANKNLIVVGGSAINSVAARLLGGSYSEGSFTTQTGIGAGQFLIKSYDDGGRTALLVAGYNAPDTEKAVDYLLNENPTTDAGTTIKKTSATFADIA